jgi:PAS domain S-box-containing protein
MNIASDQSSKWNERSSAGSMEVTHSANMFDILFERSTDAIWLYDPATERLIDCNEAAVRLMRARNKEQLLGFPFTELRLPLRSGEGQPTDSQPADRPATWQCECVARRLDGHEFPIEVVSAAVTAQGRNLQVVFSRDITERKRDEEALRQSQQLLASIADNISEAIYRSDPKHRLTFVNRAYLEMFRFESLSEIQVIPREQLYADPTARAHLLRLLNTEGSFSNQEIEYVRKDGSRFWGLASGRVIRDVATGIPGYHVGAITDITERKKAEAEIHRLNQSLEQRIAERTAELSASEARLRTLVEHAPEAIVVFDGDTGKFLSGNAHACRMYGCTMEELTRLSPADVSPEFQPDGRRSATVARQMMQQASAGGRPVFEWVHTHTSGRLFPSEVRLVRLPAEGQNLLRASIIDSTERKKAETELLKALAREKELGQLKSNFISMVSHEFRTPLGVILSSADILDSYFDQLTPSERAEQLLSIKKNTRRMAALMEEVLLLGLVEAGKMDFRPAPLSLGGFCRRIIGEVVSITNHKCRVDLVFVSAPDEVLGDERLLTHIFNNLLSNAVKYSPEGSRVQLRVSREDQSAVFRIQDHGIGIAPDDLPWLFNAFHRGRNVGHLPGTGLGLTIVRRCVELHHGCIDVDSTLGQGTTVTVRLPLFRTP